MSDISGENIGIVVSYLKGALVLLKNYSGLPKDIISLLNDIMSSTDCKNFESYMQAVYFDQKCKIKTITLMEFLRSSKPEYCTLYRK